MKVHAKVFYLDNSSIWKVLSKDMKDDGDESKNSQLIAKANW